GEGCNVTLVDNLNAQVHGTQPQDVPHGAKLVVVDVRRRDALLPLLADVEVLVHLAAETGTGQSMYSPAPYESVNMVGTAVLMDLLVNRAAPRIHKLVLASSRAVYGEGKYDCHAHGAVYPAQRLLNDLKTGNFEPLCPHCGRACVPAPTDEDSPLRPLSFYGLTKQVQEQMFFLFARALGISAVALRYQHVYGPGQSLVNPYTGILAIFANLARAGKDVHVFEDGEESRDFVYVDDAVEATWR